MNNELILRLAREAGLSDEGCAKLKRDLELYQEGQRAGEREHCLAPMLPALPTLPAPHDPRAPRRWKEPEIQPFWNKPLIVTCEAKA